MKSISHEEVLAFCFVLFFFKKKKIFHCFVLFFALEFFLLSLCLTIHIHTHTRTTMVIYLFIFSFDFFVDEILKREYLEGLVNHSVLIFSLVFHIYVCVYVSRGIFLSRMYGNKSSVLNDD